MNRRAGRLAMTAAALLLAGASAAPAQTSLAAAEVVPRADTTADPAIQREIERARVRGLPTEPLLSKVREGRLKRASTTRIRSAVLALALRLDRARATIGADATVEELTACADALAAGATAEELRAVAAAATTRPMSAPLGALAQLVASGVPPKRAAEMIVELLRKKVGGPQVLAFGNLVEADAASGVPAEESAIFRLHAIGTAADASRTLMSSPSSGYVNMGIQRPPAQSAPRRRP